MTLAPGMTFGGSDGKRFRVDAEVGQGGQGTVFKAFDSRLHRAVALKVSTATEFSEHQKIRERFERELKLSSRVNHPHVLQVYDCGELESGHPYVLLEWMERGSLAGLLKLSADQGAKIPARYIEYYARSLAVALRAVHAANMIHRDVKPDNVLISKDGVAKLTDFGIAKDDRPEAAGLTMAGMVFGTPGFMAPEQWRGAALPTSDVFAFGATLYLLITGMLPPQKKSGGYPLGDVLDEAWGPLPAEAIPLLQTLLSPDLGARPGSFDEVLPLLSGLSRLSDRGAVLHSAVLPPLPSGVFSAGATSALPVAPSDATEPTRPMPTPPAKVEDAYGATADLPQMDTRAVTGPQRGAAKAAEEPGATRPAPAKLSQAAVAAADAAIVAPPPAPAPRAVTPPPTPRDVELEVAATRQAPRASVEHEGTPAPVRRKVPAEASPEPAPKGPNKGLFIGIGLVVAVVVALVLRPKGDDPASPPQGPVYDAAAQWSAVESAQWSSVAAQQAPTSAIGKAQQELLAGRAGAALAALPSTLAPGLESVDAARIRAAALRIDGEGDYVAAAAAAQAGAATACDGPGCAEGRAALERVWTESCIVAPDGGPCADRPLPSDARDRGLAAAWILKRDGHSAHASQRLERSLSLGLSSGGPSCLEAAVLEGFARAGGLDGAVSARVSAAGRAAARDPAQCTAFAPGVAP